MKEALKKKLIARTDALFLKTCALEKTLKKHTPDSDSIKLVSEAATKLMLAVHKII